MAGGQALDLAAESISPNEQGITTLQAMKTGALLRFACEAGAIIAGASSDDRKRLRRFGEIHRPCLPDRRRCSGRDVRCRHHGKATGKDADRGKATLVARHGLEWAEERLDQLASEAIKLLEPYGERAQVLVATAYFVANRKS